MDGAKLQMQCMQKGDVFLLNFGMWDECHMFQCYLKIKHQYHLELFQQPNTTVFAYSDSGEPSAVTPSIPRALETEEVKRVTKDFVKSARLARGWF